LDALAPCYKDGSDDRSVLCNIIITRIIAKGFAVLTAKSSAGLPLGDSAREVATTLHCSALLRDSIMLTSGCSDSRRRPWCSYLRSL
jgi:hypothetical protein